MADARVDVMESDDPEDCSDHDDRRSAQRGRTALRRAKMCHVFGETRLVQQPIGELCVFFFLRYVHPLERKHGVGKSAFYSPEERTLFVVRRASWS